jgi:diaminopimelate epimerase
MRRVTFAFLKGHGTRNDFVLLPDLDGTVHGDLDPDLVRRICDRRSGVGGDGVLRVVRGSADGGAAWFMDYRNADGGVAEMCGNGVRVFARYLADAGLVDPSEPLDVETRDGVKDIVFCADGEISVDMGSPTVGRVVKVEVDGRSFEALSVDVGNPHAVAFVGRLADAGSLREAPGYSPDDFPQGVNVEFAVRESSGVLSMRVFERGVGETQSCGTGACAVAAAARHAAGDRPASSGGSPWSYPVDVPGGRLTVTFDERGHVHLKGPAVVVAEGTWTA